jgi:hypothetical protein
MPQQQRGQCRRDDGPTRSYEQRFETGEGELRRRKREREHQDSNGAKGDAVASPLGDGSLGDGSIGDGSIGE